MHAEHWGWVVAYVMAPVLVGAVTRTYAHFKRRPGSNPPEDETALFRFGVVLALLAFWPAIFIFLIGESLVGFVKRRVFDSPMDLNCQRKHLLRNSTVEKAEAGATVVDPLGRVPSAPFGHLNRGWQDFLAKKQRGDRLKSFLIPGDTTETPPKSGPTWSTQKGRKRGYAWVGFWTVKAEFIYQWN